MARKPAWVIEKEKSQNATLWLFGLHAVRDALENPARRKLRLIVTKNAADRLKDALEASDLEPEIADARKFSAPLDPGSVHQGAALEVRPIDWGPLAEIIPATGPARVLLLDRVTDPHNVGAILRSAEVFGASAVIAPQRHSAPESGALAKTASGALERQPYLRVKNLSVIMEELKTMGFQLIGLAGEVDETLENTLSTAGDRVALVLGAEGPGLRDKTRATCDRLARIPFSGAFGSLNVSNAAAISLYAVARQETT
ncbi:MAG: 23S rRNA (guanosine(2251)-2'-O)-methyltransferase RlmB [Paracoccaceae bacterium]